MNPWPIAPITDKDLNFAVVNYDFASFAGNEQSELPSLEGAIDTSLLDYAGSIADQTTLIASLFDGLDALGFISGEIDSSDNVGNTLSDLASSANAGDAALSDYAAFFQQPGSGGGGGGGNSVQCGRHGQSKIGNFDFPTCGVLQTMPICSIADGPCTFSFPLSPAQELNAPPAVFVSFTLTSGDATLWKIGGHSGKLASGDRQDYYDVTITPTAPGHYDATGTLIYQQPNVNTKVCMSVDIIP